MEVHTCQLHSPVAGFGFFSLLWMKVAINVASEKCKSKTLGYTLSFLRPEVCFISMIYELGFSHTQCDLCISNF